MQLLIAVFVFAVGFMVFGSLIYGAAKIFMNRKLSNHDFDLSESNHNKSINLRVNKRHHVYSFK